MTDHNSTLINLENVVVQSCLLPEILAKTVTMDVLRLDKIHPIISGNKWFKLQHYLKEALQRQCSCIITFGGAWSNHIIATACMSYLNGLRSVGIIRGEKPSQPSKTLQDALDYGMELHFISRESYSLKNTNAYNDSLSDKFPGACIIPEGGEGAAGIEGCKDILSLADTDKYSHIICCMGTGTMFFGLANSSRLEQEIIGMPVLKGIEYPINQFIEKPQKVNFCKILSEYHFGGYARKTAELIRFMNDFYQQTGIPSDFVYTGKLFFACLDLVRKGYFPPGSSILVIHSGGLQGNASLPEGTLIF